MNRKLPIIALLGLFFILPARAADMPEGMKKYQMVFFNKGANTNATKAEVAKAQQAHIEGLVALNTSRTNILFGPFLDGGDLRGIAVLDAADTNAALALMANDPFVKAGLMTVEVRPWLSATNVFGLPQTPHTPEKLVFGFLKRGPNRDVPAAEAQKLQRGHLDYMGELHKQGKLIAAGPFLDNNDIRGVVIYRVETVEAAQALAANDPAVKAGRLVIDARPWMTFKGMLK